MEWEFDNDKPIYLQIIEQIRLRVITGFYPPGERLPGVRELASEAGVNPNTMQKALSEMEGSGLITTNRTSGRCVTDDGELIARERENAAKIVAGDYLARMNALGYSNTQTQHFLQDYIENCKGEIDQ